MRYPASYRHLTPNRVRFRAVHARVASTRAAFSSGLRMTKTPLNEITLAALAAEGETESQLRAYVAVGRAVMVWGNLEQNFSNLVARIYHDHGGAVLRPEPPFALKRKIEFWNECFRTLAPLAAHQKAALKFSRDFAEAKKQRDDLLHFAWDVGEISKPLKGRVSRANAKGHVRETMSLPLGAINGLVNKASHLNLRLFPLAMALFSPSAVR